MTDAEMLEHCGDNAQRWAEQFCATAKRLGHDLDEGWMIGWFANAIEQSSAVRERRCVAADERADIPQPVLVVGPNTTGGSETFAPSSGLDYSAARLLLWFKCWDDAVLYAAALTPPERSPQENRQDG